MTQFRILLAVMFVAITVYTAITIAAYGTNLVPEFFGAILGMTWQGQFNFDFVMFLLLSGLWTAWRGGMSGSAMAMGALAVFFGIMFLAPYLLYLTYKTKGDMRSVILGVHTHPG